MVLGRSIRRTSSPHALVCLHTEDVSENFIALLSKLWDCRLVEHVSACTEKLSYQDSQPHRFDKVFTKLRALELVQFEKVLMMDIDLLVTGNIDELFKLRAPAALRRGMNDSRWPLKTGDHIDGRAFFGGKDSNSKWSWGQGTGINAGVMLLQPDKEVFEQMLDEIQEPNHPSHTRGNGPEQDYLSRYWADQWTYVGVEYNYQLHQMFFALHPKWASHCDRAQLLLTPEAIKVIHYSGVPAAKPWHRVLDPQFAEFWPDRSRDDEYTTLFANEFLGHWLWVKKDRATWDDMPKHHQRGEMQDLHLSEDGEIYQSAWDGSVEPWRVDLPLEVTQGSVKFLGLALRLWFDNFEDLQRALDMDLRQAVREALPSPPTAETAAVRSPNARPAVAGNLHETTVLADGSPAINGHSYPSRLFHWKRDGSWWTEQSQDYSEKLVIACCGIEGRTFVSFCECGEEAYGCHDDPDLAGVFAKVAGPHCGRHFALPALTGLADHDASELQLQEALTPLHLWVDCVPVGATVLIAVIGLAPKILKPVLSALAPLGIPQDAPSNAWLALAAVGVRPESRDLNSGTWQPSPGWFGEKRGNASSKVGRQNGFHWSSCHASRDIAYVSMPAIACHR